ncbi:hypothetical protein P4B35_06285 [Pontiellaceae bacterium B12227]|nr:hypothetical protein [Pontiellaceae bacterium B12227]
MKKSGIIGAAVLACVMGESAMAQFFTNDLTDAASVATDFNEYISSVSNSTWSYTNDFMVTDTLGVTNTVLEGGAIINWVTADTDTARSYLGTIHSNWLGKSWTAHIGMEAPNSERPYYFFGLGNPQPNEAANRYHEPRMADTVYLKFQTGNSKSKVAVYNDNGTTLYNSDAYRADPGYDIWMTYNHINKTIQFDLDDWNGGRYSDIDISTPAISIDGEHSDTNVVHIFFGSNAKVCFRDFEVYEISSDTAPLAPENAYSVISNMAVSVKWDAALSAEGYNVMRSSESGSGYVTIGSTADLTYTDTTVETNETYYYVVAPTNEIGVGNYSDEVSGVGLPYDIISDHVSTYGAGSSLDQDNLFDNDIATFYDTTSPNGGWVGLDFGTNNALQIMVVEYVLRDWYLSVERGTGATFEGANSADFSDAVILHTVPGTVVGYPSINAVSIGVETPFRYVRLKAPSARPLYSFAEVKFYTSEDLTGNGTPIAWLDSYYDVELLFGGDYAAADISDTDGDGLLAHQEYDLSGDPTDANLPAGVNNLYAWPESALTNAVRWDASAIADGSAGSGYIVYRSLDDITYEAVATVAANEYMDADVTAGVTYYYKASVTNATYDHETVLSSSEMATANENDIFGLMVNAGGAMKTRWFYELFDKNLDTFMDDNAYGGYAGLDYGVGQAFDYVAFRLRNDSFGYDGSYPIEVDGASVTVSRSPYFVYGNTFEGSNDGTTWTVLATITNMIPEMVEWNLIPITDAATYRYVRYSPANGEKNFAMGDIEFLPAGEGFTANGTLILWLEGYGLTEADDVVDTDSDGHKAWQEYAAETDPTDGDDVLKITQYSITNGLVLTWQSIEGKSYSIVTNSSLNIQSDGIMDTVIGKGGETSYTGTVSGADTVFYEIGVE